MTFRWYVLVLAFTVLLLATGQPRIAIWLAGVNVVIVLANWNKTRREW